MQLVNSVLVSTVVVRRFGLTMVGTWAIGYIAVAFLPHILSLGLTSELPRTRRPVSELMSIATVIQLIMFVLLCPCLYIYAALMAASKEELPVIFVVSLFGCFTGCFNVSLTINILLRRFRSAFVAPLAETLAIALGAMLAHSGLTFACIVLAGKALTVVAVIPRKRLRRIGVVDIMPTAIQGTKYLLLDLLSSFSDQLMPLILGVAAPRAELGLYRLCQQTMSAAETPGWSFVQGKYPEMAECNALANASVEKKSVRIGMAATACCAAGSFPLAYLLFHTPTVAPMMLVLSAALTSRYLIYVNDQRLRAEGRVLASMVLVCTRLLLFAIALLLTVRMFGLWAGIWTTTIGAIFFGWIYHVVGKRSVTRLHRTRRTDDLLAKSLACEGSSVGPPA